MGRSNSTQTEALVAADRERIGLLLGVVGIALVLRVLFLGAKSLWIDEGVSVLLARLDWPSFANLLAQYEANMAFYHVLLHLWLRLGDDEVVVRGLSVILGVATVPLLHAMGTRMFGPRVGILAALMLALNATHVAFSQEARSYALVIFLVTLSSLYFLRSLEEPSWTHWIGYVLASVLAIYSHGYAALVLVGQWVSLGLLRSQRIPWTGLIFSAVSIGILTSPIAVFFTRGVGQLGWIDPPGLRSIGSAVSLLAGGIWLLPIVLVLWLLAGVRAVNVWMTSGMSRETWHYAFLGAWAFMPALLSIGASLIKPLFYPRFLLVSLPASMLLAARGASQLRPRVVLAALLVLTVAAGFGALRYYQRPSREDWRGAVSYVVLNAKPGDALLLYAGSVRPAFEYYRMRFQGSRFGLPVLYPPAEYWPFRPGQNLERQLLGRAMETLPAGHERVWLVSSHDQSVRLGLDVVSHEIRDELAARYPVMQERQFQGVRVQIFSKAAMR